MNIIKYNHGNKENFSDFSTNETVEIMLIMFFFDRVMTKSKEFVERLEGCKEMHCYDVEKKDLEVTQTVIIPFEKDPCRFIEMRYDGKKIFEASSRQDTFTIFTFVVGNDSKAWRRFIHWAYNSSLENISEFELDSSVCRF